MNASQSLALGIAAGLASAAASAASYLVARHHGARTDGAGLRLLVPAHVLMGVACLPLVAMLWPRAAPPASAWLPPLLQSTGCYLVGQACIYAALQYAAAWLGSMVALYACFGTVGVVFGNILQSTRGIMAVVAGALLAQLGWHDLEDRVDRATLLRRLAAAGLMTAAITLFVTDVV